jgi:hypothetical protein
MRINAFKSAWGVNAAEFDFWLRDVKAKGYGMWEQKWKMIATYNALVAAGIELNPNGLADEALQRIRGLLSELSLQVIIQWAIPCKLSLRSPSSLTCDRLFSSWPDYAGPRPEGLKPADHLERYRQQLAFARTFSPILINIQSGL